MSLGLCHVLGKNDFVRCAAGGDIRVSDLTVLNDQLRGLSIQVLPDRRTDGGVLQRQDARLNQPTERTMTKTLFISLPVTELSASTAFYKALGFSQNPQFSGEDGSAMVWSEAIHVMLVTHAKWRTFTQRPFPPAGSCGMMLSLALESRAAVDAMNEAAAAHGGQADVNRMEDHGFMYTRDLADPDGHMWAALWMDSAAMPAAAG